MKIAFYHILNTVETRFGMFKIIINGTLNQISNARIIVRD